MFKIIEINDARCIELADCAALGEKLSAVIGQHYFVEVCSILKNDSSFLLMTVNRFQPDFTGVYNLTDFTENYDCLHSFELDLTNLVWFDGQDKQVMRAMFAHALDFIDLNIHV